ncbi:hypothetical protein M2105_000284 [Paenibacillus sp. PastF-1]|nr:hypothetical protein [Paenibacillus sp. PastF-2]MDF9845869.1 hypothetical protein [Paenibacillus sp. PastM-2]MDF9852442.1 hypothetical protein [Paenibacillus sp. PastF-1]MDH6477828.1 hypothetical protein [Paenibacillus sp. PastH-2]
MMNEVLQTTGAAAMILVLLISAERFYKLRDLRMLDEAEDDEAVRKAEEAVEAFTSGKS